MATSSQSSAADTPPAVWRDAGTLDDLWEGEVRGVNLGGVDVVLCNVDGELFAYEDRCPHLANPLSHGVLNHNTLRCAAHEWEFDARTGQGVNPQAARLKPFPVRVDDDRIFIQMPQESARGVDEPDRRVGPVLHATRRPRAARCRRQRIAVMPQPPPTASRWWNSASYATTFRRFGMTTSQNPIRFGMSTPESTWPHARAQPSCNRILAARITLLVLRSAVK